MSRNIFQHNKNIFDSINSFNLLEKARYNAPRNNKQITNLNPTNKPPKKIQYRIQEHNTINNYYKGVAHIDNIKKDTPPYYGVHETGAGSISYNDFFKVK